MSILCRSINVLGINNPKILQSQTVWLIELEKVTSIILFQSHMDVKFSGGIINWRDHSHQNENIFSFFFLWAYPVQTSSDFVRSNFFF